MFSQAFNNSSSLSGDPDSQTGTFSFKQPFGSIRSDSGFGPKFDFSMSYGPLSALEPNNTTGLGRGFSFTLGSCTLASDSNQTIMLNSGESYQVLQGGEGVGPWKLSHKLKDIEIKQISSDEINIMHKSGDIEILKSNASSSSSMFYLATYKSASGRILNFSYEYNRYNYYQLTEIKDTDKTVLATVEYERGKVLITINPKSSTELKKFTLTMSGNNLASIQLPDDSKICLTYKYYSVSGKSFPLIETVKYPSGATEEISYGNQMILPSNAPIEFLPALSTYKKRVSNEQLIQSTYTYTGKNNYWGNNSSVIWENNKDSLLYLDHPYDYNSTVTCGDKITTTTYNRFHQIKEVVETNGDDSCKSITTYQYYSDENVELDRQSNIYELPKSKAITYVTSSETSPEHKVQYEYDDYGNTTKKIEATGVTTIYEYHSADGDSNCPRHPYGMVCFKKTETDQPNDGSAPKVKTFTFRNIIAVDGNNERYIVPSGKTYSNCSTSYEYYGYSDPLNIQCQIKSQTVTIDGKSSTKEFDYSFGTEWLIITESLVGHDGIHSSTSKKLSRRGGLTLEHRNRMNVSTRYTYDGMDRLASLTASPGTDYEAKTRYIYYNKHGGKIGTLTTQRNSKGIRKELFYNGVSQELYQLEQDTFGQMQKTSEITYDNQGRVSSKTKFDYSFTSDGAIENTYTDVISNVYGKWGELKEVMHNNGVCELHTLDPITMTKTIQNVQQNSKGEVIAQHASSVTKYNLFGHKDQIDVLTLAGVIYSTTLYTYDGFGRSVNTTTPLNATATVNTYDDFDRPIETTHFDGTKFAFEFVNFSAKRRITSVKLSSNDFLLGEQAYDSLLRCTSRTINGVQTQYGYQSARSKPSSTLNSRGQTVLFDYIDELGFQTSRSATFTSTVQPGDWDNSSKVSDNTFTYAKSSDSAPTGRILSCASSTGKITDTTQYTSLGFIKSATQTVIDVSKTVNNTKMSLKGRVLSYSIGERQVSISYDEYGRIVRTTDGDYIVENTFGNFDLVSDETVKKNDTLLQTTSITYNEHGRETKRTISCGKAIVIENGYDVENKMLNRTTTVDSLLLNETFTYDERRHLLTYTAVSETDDLLPCNEYNKPIKSQSFVYDEIDNITSITTGFPNGDLDTATFVYDSTNKFTVNEINHTLTTGDNAYPATIAFTHDADGNVLSMNGTTMTYTVSGRVSSKNGNNYIYDSYDRLVQTNQTARFYSGASVVQECTGNSTTDFVHHGSNPVIQITDGQYNVFGLNRNASVVSIKNDASTTTTTYSPFGISNNNNVRIGFKGELKDIGDTNCYALGFGTRFFLPSIGRFSALDTFSPFTSGELNPYCYCENDPMNASDPSGHSLLSLIKDMCIGAVSILFGVASIVGAIFSGGATLVITLGVIGSIVGIASTSLSMAASVEDYKGNEGTANILNKVSLALGVLSTFLSLGSTAAGATKAFQARKLYKLAGARKSFFRLTGENDGIGGIKTSRRVGISLSKSEGKVYDIRQMKISPSGRVSLSEDIVLSNRKKVGKLAFTFKKSVALSRNQFFEGEELRSIPKTLYKTGIALNLAIGIPSGAYSFYKVVAKWNEYETKSSEPGVDAGITSAYGIPNNRTIDDHSDDEDEDGDDDDGEL